MLLFVWYFVVSPDAIHQHVKTKSEEVRWMHYVAPEYATSRLCTLWSLSSMFSSLVFVYPGRYGDHSVCRYLCFWHLCSGGTYICTCV